MNRQERRSRTKKELEQEKVFQACVVDTATILGKTFKDEPEKIVYWLFTKNGFFGGLPPVVLMNIRPEKYKSILQSLVDGNIA